MGTACTRPDAIGLVPADAHLVVHVRPEAMLRNQLRLHEMLSPAFWRMMSQRRAELGSRHWNGQLILGDFWAFSVEQVPGHYFFLFRSPEQIAFHGLNPSFRSRPIEGQPFTVAVYMPGGEVSREAFSYLVALAARQVPAWQPPPEVQAALADGSHLTVYSEAGRFGGFGDSSLFSGRAVASLYFADGVAQGRVHFMPGRANALAGHPLLAPAIALRPEYAETAGSQFCYSLDKGGLTYALQRSRSWKGISLMADFMGVPLADLVASAGQSVYAHTTPTGTLALASIDEPARAQNALVRMRRRGALAGKQPPYELMGQPDWSLQTREGRIEIRQGTPPPFPELVRCEGQGAWARLDSAGLAKGAAFAGLQRHPLARLMLPWMRSLEVDLRNLPDGTFRAEMTFRHKLRLADLFARGEDPLAQFLEGR